MYELYADGWVENRYRHIIMYVQATAEEQATLHRQAFMEWEEVYGPTSEAIFTMVVPIEFERLCA